MLKELKTVEDWIKYIEEIRLDNFKDAVKEQMAIQSECEAYYESRRERSFEEMRDYGHTWGPGCERESEPVRELPNDEKIIGDQLEVLKKMVKAVNNAQLQREDIVYLFLAKCAWDDEYPILKLSGGITYENCLLALISYFKEERAWFEQKANKYKNDIIKISGSDPDATHFFI